MSRVLLLNHDETRTALAPETLLPAVRTALIATARDETSIPPRVAAFAPAGLLGAMPGYVPGLGLAGKLVTVFAGAGPGGRSAHQGIVGLFDENDGHLLAIMNAEAVTAARTAASATVAFEALGPPDVQRIAVVGAGTQAEAQLELLLHLGVQTEVVVTARSPGSAARLVERQLQHSTGPLQQGPPATAEPSRIRSAGSVREAVSGADVVFCCTDADRPVVEHGWLRPHAHISSVGGSHGPELDRETVTRGSLFVEWPGAASSEPPAGAPELQSVPDEQVTLIGAVLCGDQPGRRADELTVYKSTGYAALDVAAAASAFERASTLGLGTRVDQ